MASDYVFQIPIPVVQDFHAVAFQPVIDNNDVMHHMIVFTSVDMVLSLRHLRENYEGQNMPFYVAFIVLTKAINLGVEAPLVITVDDYELEVVNQFTYHESLASSNLSLDKEIEKSIGKAATILARLTDHRLTQPHTCGQADNVCRSWMAQWSQGMEGTLCPYRDTGVRFGYSLASSYLLIQIHWNNAHFRPNMTDGSGMRVFYTPRIRPHDLGHVQIGQQDVVIPPGVTRHLQSGGCGGECTRMLLPHPIHLTSYHLHMHYLGAGGWLEVVHGDGAVTQVTADDSYDFSHPPVMHLSHPVTVWPGDAIRVTCVYSSKEGVQQRNTTVLFGEGSDGEMCYAFLAYFPKVPGFDQCLQLDSVDLNCHTPSNSELRECSTGFLSKMTFQYIPNVLSACSKGPDVVCCEGCQQSLDTIQSHPCMQGIFGDYMQRETLPSVPGWKDFEQVRARFSSLCGIMSLM
ncbi:MOXD1 homolog 2-like [Babylonia areolata]|uniref:MOXD1 homolog 2-like n=1 Tax=Babylonia areolata TaxID=304850 RepID=UPI003FD61851